MKAYVEPRIVVTYELDEWENEVIVSLLKTGSTRLASEDRVVSEFILNSEKANREANEINEALQRIMADYRTSS